MVGSQACPFAANFVGWRTFACVHDRLMDPIGWQKVPGHLEAIWCNPLEMPLDKIARLKDTIILKTTCTRPDKTPSRNKLLPLKAKG